MYNPVEVEKFITGEGLDLKPKFTVIDCDKYKIRLYSEELNCEEDSSLILFPSKYVFSV
jgi:hypothetical protein